MIKINKTPSRCYVCLDNCNKTVTIPRVISLDKGPVSSVICVDCIKTEEFYFLNMNHEIKFNKIGLNGVTDLGMIIIRQGTI